MHKALDQCKIETVPGIHQISSNMLKIDDEVTVNWLKVIADQIWESEVIPKDWKCQIVIQIHKNGSKSLCQNYRGISLLCVASKVFGRALLNRLQDMIESQLGENQCGFRPNRGCCDQIFSAKLALKINFKKTKFMCILPDNTDNNIRNNIDNNHNLNNKNIKINSCRNDDKNTRYNIKNNTTNNRNITTNNKNNTNDSNNNDNIKKKQQKQQ